MAKSSLLIKMIDLLKSRPGITVNELAMILNRSERTVYRWLNEISVDVGTPLYCREGGYYFTGGSEPRKVNLNPEELLALRMSLKSSPFGSGSPIGKHAESAWIKIRDSVKFDELAQARDLAASLDVSVNAPIGEQNPGIIETLKKAVDSHERLRVIYRSQHSREVRDYTIDPYAMVFRRHSWYMVGFCQEHEKVIQMKLVRFQEAMGTGVKFHVPDGFSVEDYFKLSWEAWAGGEPTRVRVRFSPDVAQMISEVKRHHTQEVFPQPDGGIVFEATVAGIEEIALWVMGFGKDAEVLEPESLRRHVVDHVSGMAAKYSLSLEIAGESVIELKPFV